MSLEDSNGLNRVVRKAIRVGYHDNSYALFTVKLGLQINMSWLKLGGRQVASGD